MELECQNLERRLALGLELSLEWEKLKLGVGLGDKQQDELVGTVFG